MSIGFNTRFNTCVYYLHIPSIMCPNCCKNIADRVEEIVGVRAEEVNPRSKTAVIRINNPEVEIDNIIAHIQRTTTEKHVATRISEKTWRDYQNQSSNQQYNNPPRVS